MSKRGERQTVYETKRDRLCGKCGGVNGARMQGDGKLLEGTAGKYELGRYSTEACAQRECTCSFHLVLSGDAFVWVVPLDGNSSGVSVRGPECIVLRKCTCHHEREV